jgi:hypothetical protein
MICSGDGKRRRARAGQRMSSASGYAKSHQRIKKAGYHGIGPLRALHRKPDQGCVSAKPLFRVYIAA